MYKKSNYIVKVENFENKSELLYNTMTGVLAVFDNKSLELLESIDLMDFENITNEETRVNIENMLKTGFIIQNNLNEYDMLKFASYQRRFSKEILTLTIAPTLGCNMSCPYCYEKDAI